MLVDHLRGHDAATAWLADLDEVPWCSEVTRTEVIVGLRASEREAAERLFATLEWAVVDEDIARRAGELGRRYRRSHRLGAADLLIAATAEQTGAALATGNVRHFPMFRGLRPPY